MLCYLILAVVGAGILGCKGDKASKESSTLDSQARPPAAIPLPPDYGPDCIQQFNETYSLLAAKYHVPLLPFLLQGVFGVDGMMQRGETHATSAGNKIVAKNVLPLVTPLLKK